MTTRRPFPQLNSFRDWVSDELKKRKTTWPTPVSAPFVRMTSCNQDTTNNYSYFTLGLHGYDSTTDLNLFDLTYGSGRDVVGYAYRNGSKTLISSDEIKYMPPQILSLSNSQQSAINNRISQAQRQQMSPTAQGAHPIPGITSVQVKRSGLAAPLIAEVKWQCYNQQQLEFLRNHFLVVGTYIVLEWGQKFHDDKDESLRPSKILDFLDFNGTTAELVQTIVKGRKYVVDNYSQLNNGNYDFIVGQVGNFTIDIDPATNIYKCSTRLVSIGENVWGLSNSQTVTVIADNNKNNVNKLSDIHSYFEGPGSRFNIKLNELSKSSDGKYCRPVQAPFNNSAPTVEETGLVGANPDDAVFISWTAFTNDIINDMIAMFQGVSSDKETQSMYEKLTKELRSLLGLGGPPIQSQPADVLNEQNRLYDLEWVGYHPQLRSADPYSLVLITPSVVSTNPSQEWLQNGVFGSLGGGKNRGKLTEGVWINAEMIRQAFLNNETLQASFQEILSKLNIAVGGYWQLQLFYDDEISVYKIIDYKFDQDLEQLKFYVFNSHSNFHHNETLDIRFDSAFPPELITQMMIVSMIQTSSPAEQEALFKRYPLINSTSPFMFAVNWTTLEDVLKTQVETYRKSHTIPLGGIVNHTALGTATNQTTGLAVGTRVVDSTNIGPLTSKSPSEAGIPATPRTTAGSATIPSISSDNTKAAPTPRTSPTPPKNSPIFELDTHPVDSSPLVITSPMGSRNVSSNPAASKMHKGVDIRSPQGSPVRAVKSGRVDIANPNSGAGGGLVVIDHGNGYQTLYMHLSNIIIKPGTKVSAGQLIAYSGGSAGTPGAGNSSAPHLHFEVRKYSAPIDPIDSLATVGSVQIKQSNGTLVSISPPTKQQVQTNLPPFSAPVPNTTTTAQANVPATPTSAPTSPVTDPTLDPSYVPIAESVALAKKIQEYQMKFGSDIIKIIYPTVSILRNTITTDGYQNLNNKLINAFITPFPTKTSVEVRIQGISGISISDGFMVDKLPFIFANYGVFQVTEIRDDVTDKGWYTTVRGFFKLIWPDGSGGQRDE